ncbi:MAG: glycosyltransferase [Vampirovibrionales bacterium]|nr:glycosyltransferase [Vampirovibrionales bacterium]
MTATLAASDISLELVKTNPENFDYVTAYEEGIGPEFLAELRELLPKLKNVKMAHVNATAYGGGVAELLHRQIPLMNQLGKEVGFQSDWYILKVSNTAFYDVTKKMHNTLQGAPGELSAEEKDLYKKTQIENFSEGLLNDYDVVLIHDPQPAGLIELYSKDRKGKWAWRCHIDTTTTNANVWGFIGAFAKQYEAAIWTREQFVQDKADFKEVKIIPPSIDPLSPKNYDLSETQVDEVFHRYGIDRSRPVLCQISRFDPWKQPVEVVKIYQEMKKEFPELQLIYAGSMATDDPEGMFYWEQTLRAAGLDKDVTILNNFHGVGNIEINAFQRGADVMIQYSSKEGFGLTISEAMWKEQPIIGGRVGGIQDQIVDKDCGYLVSTNEEVKTAIRELLSNPEKRKEMGKKAKKRVQDNFLITKEVGNYMKLAIGLLGR